MGDPLGVGGWLSGEGVSGATPTHVHTYMHVKHDKHGCLHRGSHLQFLYTYILVLHMCMCMCVCVCVHVGTCEGHPQTHLPTHTHTHTHTFHQQEPFGLQITKNVIKLKLNEIIQFHLKILDLCTFLHLYRLGLVCRWSSVPSQIEFFTFGPKKVHIFCSSEPPDKILLVFISESDRPYLD